MEEQESQKYGTFLGVFTPSILTILGAIMYLRFGWVVGNSGLYSALVIVIIANVITLITAFSVSSLATSQRVGVGGAYYLISRALGVEMGAAIGLPLYLSQAVSLTLYCYALSESIQILWPAVPVQLFAGIFIILVTASALRATDLVLKSQVGIFVLVGLSIVSLAWGADWGAPVTIIEGNYSADDATGFWQVFAVFFPAVTGILTGLSLSGDLKDPEKSLPWGTLGAVFLGMVIYILIPLALSHHSPEELRNNPLVWLDVAAVSWLIIPGLISAILSSAIGSILAAPRTLKALADDGVLPERFGRTENGEPKFAMYLSGGVALLAVLLGDLNAVATVVTMFFLTTYGMVNIVAGLEGLVGNPSYRPRMRVHWALSFAAALGCFAVMMLINPVASLLAIIIEGGIYFYLSRRTLESTWGDMRAGLMMAVSRWALLAHRHMIEHRRNWRPHILVFSSDVRKNLAMIELADDFSLGRGIVTVAHLYEGDAHAKELQQKAAEMNQFLTQRRIDAFCEVDMVPSISSGILTVSQANGIAGLQSNTVMLGWPSATDFPLSAAQLMHQLDQLGKSILVSRLVGFRNTEVRTIDVWWSGTQENGDLMLLLAHLLMQSRRWRRSSIRLKTVVSDSAEIGERQAALHRICKDTRINAEPIVLKPNEGQSIPELIRQDSAQTDLVLLGLALPNDGEEKAFAERYQSLIQGLDNVILVRNSGPFRGELIHSD
ncbi:MAG: Na-K-Cl cotransporter [Myxococcota bacterium]